MKNKNIIVIIGIILVLAAIGFFVKNLAEKLAPRKRKRISELNFWKTKLFQ